MSKRSPYLEQNVYERGGEEEEQSCVLMGASVFSQAMLVLKTLSHCCPNFLSQRFTQIWPQLEKILAFCSQKNSQNLDTTTTASNSTSSINSNKNSHSSTSSSSSSSSSSLPSKKLDKLTSLSPRHRCCSHSSNFKIQAAILTCLRSFLTHSPSLVRNVLPNIVRTVLNYALQLELQSPANEQKTACGALRVQAIDVLRSIGSVDADLLWWQLHESGLLSSSGEEEESKIREQKQRQKQAYISISTGMNASTTCEENKSYRCVIAGVLMEEIQRLEEQSFADAYT